MRRGEREQENLFPSLPVPPVPRPPDGFGLTDVKTALDICVADSARTHPSSGVERTSKRRKRHGLALFYWSFGAQKGTSSSQTSPTSPIRRGKKAKVHHAVRKKYNLAIEPILRGCHHQAQGAPPSSGSAPPSRSPLLQLKARRPSSRPPLPGLSPRREGPPPDLPPVRHV